MTKQNNQTHTKQNNQMSFKKKPRNACYIRRQQKRQRAKEIKFMKAQAELEREPLVKAVNLTPKSKTINLLPYRGLLRERHNLNVKNDIYLNAPRIVDDDPRVSVHERPTRVFESRKVQTYLIPLKPLSEDQSPTILSHKPKNEDQLAKRIIELNQREEALLKKEHELKALEARLELEEDPDRIIIYALF